MRFNISNAYRESREPHRLKYGDGVRATFMDIGTLHIERSEEHEECRRKEHVFSSRMYKAMLLLFCVLPLLLGAFLFFSLCDIFKTAKRSVRVMAAPTQTQKYFDASEKEFITASAFAQRVLIARGGVVVGSAGQGFWPENMPPQMREPARRLLSSIESPGEFQVFKVEVLPALKPSYRIVLKGRAKSFLIINCVKTQSDDSLKLVSACMVNREKWL